MSYLEDPITPFEGVSAGGKALNKLPIGLRYHDLYLKYSGVTLAQLTNIELKANGKTFQRFSATERDTMNQFDRMSAAGGRLRMPLDRWVRERGNVESTAVNTGVRDETGNIITSFQVEIDIDAAASAPVLDLEATRSPAVAGGPGVMLHIRKQNRTIAGAGELEVSDYIYGTLETQLINRIFFRPSAGTLDRVEIERDLRTIWDREAALNTQVQTDHRYRAPQAGYFVVDPSERGYGGNTIDVRNVQDLRVLMDCSAAMTVNGVFEYIGGLGR